LPYPGIIYIEGEKKDNYHHNCSVRRVGYPAKNVVSTKIGKVEKTAYPPLKEEFYNKEYKYEKHYF